ncbi:MAG TPA: hypothetical protein DGG95_08510 [Cytophagales bacterium]|nr:hypothetical protein [Cytophagales bacterium]
MKIIYVSYAQVKADDPKIWLSQISFYTGILEHQAKEHKIISFHSLDQQATLTQNSVEYRFINSSRFKQIFPFALNQQVVSENPNIIIVHGLHFGWHILWLRLQLRKRIKIFVWHHAEKPKRFPKNILQQIADRFINGYFFVSKKLAQPWVDKNQIQSIEKVHELMEASSAFTSANKMEAREKTGIQGNHNYLWVGRLDENKDPVTLIQTFQKFTEYFPKANLYIIFRGGNLQSVIKKLIDTSSEKIHLIGEIEHRELSAWYNSVEFIISTSHYEGSGIAICEGMSCGCIPILTSIPSFDYMTSGGSVGLLFEAGNPESLLSKLKESTTLDMNQERQRVLKLFSERLSFSAIANRIQKVITSE